VQVGASSGRGGNPCDLYVRGEDDKIWWSTWSSGQTWTAFKPLGGVLVSSPATATKSTNVNRRNVVASMPEERSVNEIRNGLWWKEYAP
jgi:hypothetical protein